MKLSDEMLSARLQHQSSVVEMTWQRGISHATPKQSVAVQNKEFDFRRKDKRNFISCIQTPVFYLNLVS
jgi:hypothetical protein